MVIRLRRIIQKHLFLYKIYYDTTYIIVPRHLSELDKIYHENTTEN